MLNNANTLKGYKLLSLDGEIGEVREFYFDDLHWVVRYLVADTGNWLNNRQVLISPCALAVLIEEQQSIAIDLTQPQIEASPALYRDLPVSREFEVAYCGYYGWPAYWDGPHRWGPSPDLGRDRAECMESIPGAKPADLRLHSTADVSACHLQAGLGELGHVEDFIIDDETWAIRYLIVETGNWWPGKKVLVSPQWIERVSWRDSKVFVTLPGETPEYDESRAKPHDHETRSHPYEQHEGYCARNDRLIRTAESHRYARG